MAIRLIVMELGRFMFAGVSRSLSPVCIHYRTAGAGSKSQRIRPKVTWAADSKRLGFALSKGSTKLTLSQVPRQQMPFIPWVMSLFTKELVGTVKDGAEAAEAATAIPKNIIETKKLGLEVKELEQKADDQKKLIVPATFDDVKEFDVKFRRIRTRIKEKTEGDLVEYSLLLAPLAFGLLVSLPWIASQLSKVFDSISKALAK